MPNFLIIGTQKGGTTSLYNYLIQHPQILAASAKEVHFFDFNFSKGINWYRSQFPAIVDNQNTITGEASPYYLFHPLVPARVYQHFPQLKLIVLLRDPITRALSHYYHEVRLGFENLSLSEAISKEAERMQGEIEKIIADENYYSYNHQHYSYLSRGIYIEQLQRWQKYFPSQQFLIIKSEDFYANPGAIVQEVLKFLELPDRQFNEYKSYNAGDYPRNINPEIYSQLKTYFQPYNQQLETYLGKKIDW